VTHNGKGKTMSEHSTIYVDTLYALEDDGIQNATEALLYWLNARIMNDVSPTRYAELMSHAAMMARKYGV